jgi:hypothetical protein
MATMHIFQMGIKYSNVFNSKALQNLPKLWVLVWKYASTIWQPRVGDIFPFSNIHIQCTFWC